MKRKALLTHLRRLRITRTIALPAAAVGGAGWLLTRDENKQEENTPHAPMTSPLASNFAAPMGAEPQVFKKWFFGSDSKPVQDASPSAQQTLPNSDLGNGNPLFRHRVSQLSRTAVSDAGDELEDMLGQKVINLSTNKFDIDGCSVFRAGTANPFMVKTLDGTTVQFIDYLKSQTPQRPQKDFSVINNIVRQIKAAAPSLTAENIHSVVLIVIRGIGFYLVNVKDDNGIKVYAFMRGSSRDDINQISFDLVTAYSLKSHAVHAIFNIMDRAQISTFFSSLGDNIEVD